MKKQIDIIDDLWVQLEYLESIVYLRNLVLEEIAGNKDTYKNHREETIFRCDEGAENFLLECETAVYLNIKRLVSELWH